LNLHLYPSIIARKAGKSAISYPLQLFQHSYAWTYPSLKRNTLLQKLECQGSISWTTQLVKFTDSDIKFFVLFIYLSHRFLDRKDALSDAKIFTYMLAFRHYLLIAYLDRTQRHNLLF
jgi:hypothetical protein